MKCWICGAPAGSGEHLPKDSTLKDLFGEVTQHKPLHHSSARGRNKRLQSTNSKLVKLRVLCVHCNSSRTQPMDRAWDGFMDYLARSEGSLRTGSSIRFYRVFGHGARQEMLNFHLYAIKLFGCVAAEHSIPLDLPGMADSILRNRPFECVYVGLGHRTWLQSLKVAGPSDVEADLDQAGKCVFAVWFLAVGKWEFQFIYAVPGQKREGLVNTWNPAFSRRIRLKEFVERKPTE